jgi:hypothetical protein
VAIDDQGHFGPPHMLMLAVKDAQPQGLLVVSLSWDTEADLDLHVVQPDGIEIWAKNINAFVPPGPMDPPADPDTISAGGILDFDSNSSCQIDGRRLENVVWKKTVPSGHYLVRVDTYSLCAAPYAHWGVKAVAGEAVLGQSHGESVDTDTRDAGQMGAGVLALEFDIP